MISASSGDDVAFPRLSDSQLAHLDALAVCVEFADGDLLVEAGARDFPFFVVKDGEVLIEEHSSGEPRSVAVHGPGQFTGDVDLLTGRPSVVSAKAQGRVQAYRVEASRIREVLNDLPSLSDCLLEAFQTRRQLLEKSGFLGIQVVGSGRCPAANELREFLYKNTVPHTFVDVDDDEEHASVQRARAQGELPALVCGEAVRSAPSLRDAAECIGLRRDVQGAHFDFIVIGAGPAGLAAAVYGGSEGLKTLVLDGMGPGGQAGTSSKIENYMGFPAGLSGADLAYRGYLQALKFGVTFSSPVQVTSITRRDDGVLRVRLDDGEEVQGDAVLVATGASYRRLACEGCDRFWNAGVFGAATSVEARLCRHGSALVIGGGNSAGQAALFLAEHAAHVVMVLRSGDLRKSMSEYLAHRIDHDSRIDVRLESEVQRVEGDTRVQRAVVRHNPSASEEALQCAAVFSFIGAQPHTDWLPSTVSLDSRGFVFTGADIDRTAWPLERDPCVLETSLPGVFAAGDVRHGTTKRVAFAVGDGALAVTCVHQVRGA